MRAIIKLVLFFIALISTCYAGAVTTSTTVTTTSTAASQTQTQATLLNAIDAQVNQVMTSKNIPGYHLTVIQNGQVILNKGYGVIDTTTKIPVTNQTVFGLASITKTFTAMALLKLVELGKVNLDAPLKNYINNLSSEYQNITIRQLASMTAGIPQGVPTAANQKWPTQFQILMHTPLISQPGQSYKYSNFSYRFLGQVIENVTSKPYSTFIKQLILSPLQMNSTGTMYGLKSSNVVASPYADNLGKGSLNAISYRDPEVEFSAGMLGSSGDDLIKYVQALLNNQILQPASYQTLWYIRPGLPNGTAANWAFGWGSRVQADGKRIISMNGADPGVASSIIMVPQTKCAVIGLSNVRDPAVYGIARRVAHMACGVQPGNQQNTDNTVPAGLN